MRISKSSICTFSDSKSNKEIRQKSENGEEKEKEPNGWEQEGASGPTYSRGGNDVTSCFESMSTSCSTMSLPLTDVVFLNDPNPIDLTKQENAHKYGKTKSFHSRLLTSDQRLQYIQVMKDQFHSKKLRSLNTSLGSDKNRWASYRVKRVKNTKKRDGRNSPSAVSSKKRLISPWVEDDPVKLENLEKRAQSAPVSVSNNACKGKPTPPGLSRANTILTLLDEFDLEKPVQLSHYRSHPNDRKPMPDRYIKAYLHHRDSMESGQGLVAQRDSEHAERAPPSRGVCPNNNRPMTTERMWPPTEQAGRHTFTVTKIPLDARKMGPKQHSPAGYLRTLTDTTEHKTKSAPSYHGNSLKSKLPVIKINNE